MRGVPERYVLLLLSPAELWACRGGETSEGEEIEQVVRLGAKQGDRRGGRGDRGRESRDVGRGRGHRKGKYRGLI